MAQYKLTYARTVILTTVIEADSEEAATRIAFELEENGRLSNVAIVDCVP